MQGDATNPNVARFKFELRWSSSQAVGKVSQDRSLVAQDLKAQSMFASVGYLRSYILCALVPPAHTSLH